ncbi:MAG: MBL fold metallo-hydrolase [Candidatus Methanomethylicia archaeon]
MGRSAIMVKADGTRILLDYGVALNDVPEFPLHVAPRDVDGVIVTHAHLDHSGAIPILYAGRGVVKTYTTSLTFETMRILLEDFIKLSGYYLPFEYSQIDDMAENYSEVFYSEVFRIGSVEVEFRRSGHIPGGFQVFINADKTLVYTSDFSAVNSRLLKGADTNLYDVDAVIVESTYACENHPPRRMLEAEFVKSVNEVVGDGGIVLIPAFSVGRSQEILCILTEYGVNYPIYVDGMAVRVLDKYLESREFIDGYALLEKASRKALIVNGSMRRKILKNPCIIISPAGMLKGGPSLKYAWRLADNRKAAIFLVSFQIPGTPGARLLSEKRIERGGVNRSVTARVEQYRFSSHSDMDQLHSLLKSLKSEAKVFTVHGENGNCSILADWARRELNLQAKAPDIGVSYII